MLTSQQLEPVIGFATTVTLMAGVAAMVGWGFSAAMKGFKEGEEHHSIPWEDKARLSKLYGTWAVNRSEAMCPENDVACVEREAKRLLEVMKYRR